MPSRHSAQTIYQIHGRYFSAVAHHPDRLRLGSIIRAACDELDHYQGRHSNGYVIDALWRVEDDRLATEQEVKQLSSEAVPGNPLQSFSQFRIVTLALSRAAQHGPKLRLHYLWWVTSAVVK